MPKVPPKVLIWVCRGWYSVCLLLIYQASVLVPAFLGKEDEISGHNLNCALLAPLTVNLSKYFQTPDLKVVEVVDTSGELIGV